MSETTTTAPAVPAAPGPDPAVTPAAPVVPEGYVPAATVDQAREEARRQYQGEKDKLEAEVKRLKAVSAPAPGIESAPAAQGFDPDAFRRQLLTDVSGVIGMTQASDAVRAEFKFADPGLFAPAKLAEFGSPEALRFAAQDSHKRVADILATEKAAVDEAARTAAAAGAAGAAGPVGAGQPAAGDPTPEQLNAMPMNQWDALEKASPGVIDRVLAMTAGA